MANTAKSVRLLPEALRTLAFGAISGAYAAVGTPLSNPARLVKFKNNTDAVLYVSWDGVTDHVALPPFSGDVEDVTSNKSSPEGMYIAQGTQFYVRDEGAAATEGAFYLEVRYGYRGD